MKDFEPVDSTLSANDVLWYPSKLDWWVIPVLFLSPMAAVVVCVVGIVSGQWPMVAIGGATMAFVLGIYFGLVFPIRYGLDDSDLVIRFGLCRQRIPLADITEIHPTNNPLSAPALSIDRLHVQFGEGFLNSQRISPADRDGFLDAVAARTGLARVGDRLVRGPGSAG